MTLTDRQTHEPTVRNPTLLRLFALIILVMYIFNKYIPDFILHNREEEKNLNIMWKYAADIFKSVFNFI